MDGITEACRRGEMLDAGGLEHDGDVAAAIVGQLDTARALEGTAA